MTIFATMDLTCANPSCGKRREVSVNVAETIEEDGATVTVTCPHCGLNTRHRISMIPRIESVIASVAVKA